MAKIKVTVKAHISGRRITTTLDNTPLLLNNGVGSRDVEPGTHGLGWVVEGKGSSYTVEVTTPPSAVYKRDVQKTGQEITYGTKQLDVH